MSTGPEAIRRRIEDPARLAAVRRTGLLDTPAEVVAFSGPVSQDDVAILVLRVED